VTEKTFAAVTTGVPLSERLPEDEGEITRREARHSRGRTETTSRSAKQIINIDEPKTAPEHGDPNMG